MALPVPKSSSSKQYLSRSKGSSLPRGSLKGSLPSSLAGLTPKQQAIHQQTVQRHLSARKLPVPPLSPLVISQNSDAIKIAGGNKKSNFKFDKEESQSSQFLIGSQSVVGDLPDFKHDKYESKSDKPKKKGRIKRNKSDPALSALQQQKRETGVYMAHGAIPRSLSATFADYQPGYALNLLMDLPTEAFIGIGGGIKKSLQQALVIATKLEEQERSVLQIKLDESQGGIPSAPTHQIPPTSIIHDDISDKRHIDEQIKRDHDSSLPAPPSPQPPRDYVPDQRQYGISAKEKMSHAEEIKHDIETALKQGYTKNLVIAIIQGILGAFLYGWNISLLNVPQDVIQDETNLSDNGFAALQSAFCGGGLVGALIAGFLADAIGRKKSLLIVDVLFIISAAIYYFYAVGVFGDVDDSSNYIYFYLTRVVAGMAGGMATGIVPTYLGEISPPVIRGAVGTLNQLTICFGIVVVEFVGYKSMLGAHNTWQYLFIGNALPILQLLTAFTFPESPKWLIQKGKESEARKSLQHLRQTQDVRIDMLLMKGGLLHAESFHTPHISPKHGKKIGDGNINRGGAGIMNEPLLDDHDGGPTFNAPMVNESEFNRPTKKSSAASNKRMDASLKKAVIWALIISIVLMLMQQFSGINAVFFYSASILKKAGLKSDKAQWIGSLGISIANFFAVFIAVATIDKAGRRVLLILSCIGMVIASLLVSLSLMLNGGIWHYLSIAFLVCFVIAFETGLGAIPWVMMAELSPIQYRGLIVSVATFANWASNLMIAQFSGPLIHYTYFFPFAAVCAAGIVFTLKFIPETNGKTAGQIQKELSNM